MQSLSLKDIEITILPGMTRNGTPENYDRIVIRPGDTISIVGPTGCGKTAFINDIEVFAQKDTVTGRTVLVNGEVPPEEFVRDPAYKPIAMITQNTKCLADLTVREFLDMHMKARETTGEHLLEDTIALANEFTGEKILPDIRMSSLSGGQTRSLMIADAVMISDAPVLLLDEIENAGIFKEAVIEHLKHLKRTVIFVTHDPYVALLTDRRIVVIDGDGSMLGSSILPVLASESPDNLTVFCMDNGTFGSTGNQMNQAYAVSDLELAARAYGIRDTMLALSPDDIAGAFREKNGVRFVRVPISPGNSKSPNIPMNATGIRDRFSAALRA